MKRISALLLVLAMAFGLVACGGTAETASADVAMQYITPEDAKGLLEDDAYIFFDIRKTADSSVTTVPGAQAWDMDAAKEGDAEAGKAAMTEATNGLDKNIILVCYSGKRYAQAATNALSAIGYDMSKVYTLEGGFTAWSEKFPELCVAPGAEEVPAETEAAVAETEAAAEAEVTARTVYVDAEYVKGIIDGNKPESENYVIINAEYPMTSADWADYGAGHVPGAIYASIQEVEDALGDEIGAYNLLAAEEIRDYALTHGITKDTAVILYGSDVSGVARQAFGYIYIGVENVKILNGSLDAWTAAGYELETTENVGTAASDFGVAVPANPQYWTSIEDAKAKVESDPNFKLVSIRSEAEWLGETSGYSYMDKAGEPKGAVWGKGAQTAFDVADFTNEDGTVKDLAGVLAVWEGCDFTLDNHLAFYCGTGWRACVPFLVLYAEGYDNISVYDGGWYQWLMDDSNPVQVGDPASGDVVYTTVGELETGKAASY